MVSRKTLKKIDFENFRSESFSIRTSEGRTPASELVLQRGSLPSEIATAGLFDSSSCNWTFFISNKTSSYSWTFLLVYRGVGADFEKPKKYFRYTILDSRLLPCNFRSESFSIRTSEGRAPASELVLQRGSLPSEIATAALFDQSS